MHLTRYRRPLRFVGRTKSHLSHINSIWLTHRWLLGARMTLIHLTSGRGSPSTFQKRYVFSLSSPVCRTGTESVVVTFSLAPELSYLAKALTCWCWRSRQLLHPRYRLIICWKRSHNHNSNSSSASASASEMSRIWLGTLIILFTQICSFLIWSAWRAQLSTPHSKMLVCISCCRVLLLFRI